jgi:predicted nucleic acid-binding protein
MIMLLLDTDVMVDILRRYPPALSWLESVSDTQIALPGFVVMELIQGCKDKQEQERLRKDLEKFDIVWPEKETCQKALNTFSMFYLSNGIGIMDSLIGQIAADMGVTLCTFNKKHYEIIPEIHVSLPYERLR